MLRLLTFIPCPAYYDYIGGVRMEFVNKKRAVLKEHGAFVAEFDNGYFLIYNKGSQARRITRKVFLCLTLSSKKAV